LALLNVNMHLPGAAAEKALHDLGDPVWIALHWGGYPAFDSLVQQHELEALRDREVPQGHMVWLRPGDSAQFMHLPSRKASERP
jgi:hypothetical protein